MKISQDVIDNLRSEINLDVSIFDEIFESFGDEHIKFINSLILDGYISRKTYGHIIGAETKVAYLPLAETLVEQEALTLIPSELSETLGVICVYKFGTAVTVATSDPFNDQLKIKIECIAGVPVSFVFSFSDEIANAIKINYNTLEDIKEISKRMDLSASGASELGGSDLERLSQSKEVIRLCDSIIFLALKERASDIHIEPKKNHVVVRFRRNGQLQNKSALGIDIFQALVSRFKIIGRLDISKRRTPQDGRFTFQLPKKDVDIRISTLPSLHGEKVVMRLLGSDMSEGGLEFERLGFFPEMKAHVLKGLDTPNGMLFVTGPTGSGKTTTLHCALQQLCDPTMNVVSIEDPIEYEHPNITQVSIDEKADRGFSTVLRSILRQDPDVIMIGEIRDLETAKIAANAALTGHMVLTSLHTNNAAQAVTRLIEMGVEHFVIAPSIIGVLGQRLVRRICNHCKEEYDPPIEILSQVCDIDVEVPILYKGVGCRYCEFTGYAGRIAIHEYLSVDDQLRQDILNSNNSSDFYNSALQSECYIHFWEDALRKIILGVTTIEEVFRVIGAVGSTVLEGGASD